MQSKNPIQLNVVNQNLKVKKAVDREFQLPKNPPTKDYRKELFALEAAGEIEIIRVPEPFVEVDTKYGRKKKIPIEHTWHHKSCGQCGHIPGYSTSIYWLNREFGLDYYDPRDQTSCTAWNYYASAASNPAAQAAIACRNFAQAKIDGYFPLIHCGTSYGHYKEVRAQLLHFPELREQVRKILDRLGLPFVFPEEIVHYSEWVHVMRHRIAEKQTRDFSKVTATVHPACHYHKLISEDAIYDRDLYDGQRTAIVTGVVEALGAKVADYSTFHDCCGFGFRHILVSRDFSRSFATIRKIERMKIEADPDVTITHDTGCVTTLDKSQFSTQAHNRKVGIPVISDAQFAALAMGAHPYLVCQLHWHGVDNVPLLELMGIDHEKAWKEFEEVADKLQQDPEAFLTWEDV
ncbi:MAG: heterodisulfide reductase subunit B [Euryarchaeota archaeon]|jgi:heterodisulfide reductase subunit B|nr:heterodisulfide reductase subunit B [Euryarchaeota archaeon]MBT3653919.1 heterodisulfide reductase subunit B [Euryarchaeota archaeon]MBT3757323.1 heterodisulfide reductase subunit B [Euryarchaeota archaeon]MBT4050132.1 heterodisulfide reductase subunit B [Euryarchaeota archaeon]MBT4346865.1 heterodisulfide reductase subunit B [Euryarchaeota archaeon]